MVFVIVVVVIVVLFFVETTVSTSSDQTSVCLYSALYCRVWIWLLTDFPRCCIRSDAAMRQTDPATHPQLQH